MKETPILYHRIVEAGRTSGKPSIAFSSTAFSLWGKALVGQAAQGQGQEGSEHLRGCPCLATLTEKNFYLTFK